MNAAKQKKKKQDGKRMKRFGSNFLFFLITRSASTRFSVSRLTIFVFTLLLFLLFLVLPTHKRTHKSLQEILRLSLSSN